MKTPFGGKPQLGAPIAIGISRAAEWSEPPIRPPEPLDRNAPVRGESPIPSDYRSPERAMLSQELAILNRPLEDEIEYYDEVPHRRWPKRIPIVLALAAAAGVAYLFAAPRLGAKRSAPIARLPPPMSSSGGVAGWTPIPVALPSLAVGAPGAASSLTQAARAVGSTRPDLAAPAPSASQETRSTTSAVGEDPDEAPVAEHRARTSGFEKASRSTRRYPFRKLAASRR